MTDPPYRLEDLGDRRVLTVGGRDYPTAYSARVVRMLVERKGPLRAPQYFSFKETRGRRFLAPLFAYLRARGADSYSSNRQFGGHSAGAAAASRAGRSCAAGPGRAVRLRSARNSARRSGTARPALFCICRHD